MHDVVTFSDQLVAGVRYTRRVSAIPVVTVLLPVCNGGGFFREAVESILSQTFRDFELIIVDDGSTDESPAAAEEFARRDARVRVLRRVRGGYARALNAALANTQSELVARMDADDVAYPERLQKQVDFLAAHPECVAVGTAIEAIDEEGHRIGVTYFAASHESIEAELLRGSTSLSHPTVMARRQAIIDAGGYNPELYPSEDFALWLRLTQRGKLANIREPLLKYRRHEGAVGVRDRAGQLQMTSRILNEVRSARGLSPARMPLLSAGRIARARYHFDCARFALVGGRRRVAMKHAVRCILLDPWWSVPYLTLLASLFPRRLLRVALEKQARYRTRGSTRPEPGESCTSV